MRATRPDRTGPGEDREPDGRRAQAGDRAEVKDDWLGFDGISAKRHGSEAVAIDTGRAVQFSSTGALADFVHCMLEPRGQRVLTDRTSGLAAGNDDLIHRKMTADLLSRLGSVAIAPRADHVRFSCNESHGSALRGRVHAIAHLARRATRPAVLLALCLVEVCALEVENTRPAALVAEGSCPSRSVYAGGRLFQDKCAALMLGKRRERRNQCSHQSMSAPSLNPSAVLNNALLLQRAARAGRPLYPLHGSHIALVGEAGNDEGATLVCSAATSLGAMVTRLRPLTEALRTAELARLSRVLDRLYDALDCEGAETSCAALLEGATQIPIFAALGSSEHPSASLADLLDPADPWTSRRRHIVQAVLLTALR